MVPEGRTDNRLSHRKGTMSQNNLFPDEGPDRRLYPTPRMRRPEETVRWYLKMNPIHRRRAFQRAQGTRLARRFVERLWKDTANRAGRDFLA